MRYRSVNLASRPFSNQVPVVRAALVLGLVGLTMTVLNVSLYWSYFSGSGEEARDQLEQTDARINAIQGELDDIDRELQRYDLVDLKQQVEFLNLRIAERSFGWGKLFEDLAEVVPKDVRLTRLSPEVVYPESSNGDSGVRVGLAIQGAAKDNEALLDFIDALFDHADFDEPNPSGESMRDGELRFGLDVVYRPRDAVARADDSDARADS